MRAVVRDVDGEVRLVHDYPSPPVMPDGALVRVRRTAITRTDLEVAHGYRTHAGPLGLAFVGYVQETGSADKALVGARVTGELNFGCGGPLCQTFGEDHCPNRFVLGIAQLNCPYTPNWTPVGGAMSDYVSLPLRNLHRLPDGMTDGDGVFVELVAAAMRILEQVHVQPTDRVAIVGDGPFGFVIAQVLRLPGSEVTAVGKYGDKLACFAEQGIDTIHSEDPVDGYFDITVDCTGSPSGLNWALAHTRPKGTVVMKNTVRAHGDEIDLARAVVDEISLVSSRSGPFQPAIRTMLRGSVVGEPFVSHTVDIEDAIKGLALASSKGVRRVDITLDD